MPALSDGQMDSSTTAGKGRMRGGRHILKPCQMKSDRATRAVLRDPPRWDSDARGQCEFDPGGRQVGVNGTSAKYRGERSVS